MTFYVQYIQCLSQASRTNRPFMDQLRKSLCIHVLAVTDTLLFEVFLGFYVISNNNAN